jgi:hypothetical protein
MGKQNLVSWIGAVVVAVLFLITLFFKFSGAEESVYIFTQLSGSETEAFGRIGSGIAELIVSILILIPKTRVLGAIGALGVISGAILSHLTVLGIEVKGDGGLLFGEAVLIFILSALVLFIHRTEIPFIGTKA